MTNLYIFWRKTTDPPLPWTRLTRTNQYLRFNSSISNHWTQTGATTHIHSSATITINNSVHLTELSILHSSPVKNVMGPHNDHPVTNYSITKNNNNNPPGWGLDIIYTDLTNWETNVRSFPEGSIIMSNGTLVDANLERYTAADGKYIVHTTPEAVVGTNTAQSHTISGNLGNATGSTYSTAYYTSLQGDEVATHSHTFNFASEAKYVEPKNLVTRLYHALHTTSKAVAGSVVFVDGSVSANWEILTGWAGGNLKSGNSDPTKSGSDTHTQSLSGNSSTYDGPNVFAGNGYPSVIGWNAHYHPITGSLAAANHVPSSRYIIPARLLYDIKKTTMMNRPQIIGLP